MKEKTMNATATQTAAVAAEYSIDDLLAQKAALAAQTAELNAAIAAQNATAEKAKKAAEDRMIGENIAKFSGEVETLASTYGFTPSQLRAVLLQIAEDGKREVVRYSEYAKKAALEMLASYPPAIVGEVMIVVHGVEIAPATLSQWAGSIAAEVKAAKAIEIMDPATAKVVYTSGKKGNRPEAVNVLIKEHTTKFAYKWADANPEPIVETTAETAAE